MSSDISKQIELTIQNKKNRVLACNYLLENRQLELDFLIELTPILKRIKKEEEDCINELQEELKIIQARLR
jgi:hypothetical protein